MNALNRYGVAALTTLGLLAGAATASAAPALAASDNAVFVQSDNLTGNTIVAYQRASDGTLTQEGTYPTGGLGGQLEGSQVDHLASQGSLAYDAQAGLLFAVNAGSNTVSVFAVLGDHLALRQTVPSGGTFPSSIAVHGNLVYVLNSEDGGSVQGFTVKGTELVAIAGSGRSLELPIETPQFVHTPGQIAFTPSGAQLLVTTKAAGNDIDVFKVTGSGISAEPVVNSVPGVPFAISYDRQGHVVIAEAAGSLASFELAASGTLTQLDSVATGQAATCWVVDAKNHFFASNAGSGSLTAFSSTFGGRLLSDLGNTPTNGGTVDATATDSGSYIYVRTGAEGIVDEFAVGAHGALTEIGTVTVPGAIGGEGIVTG